MYTEVLLANNVSTRMIVDTAANATIIFKDTAQRAGLETVADLPVSLVGHTFPARLAVEVPMSVAGVKRLAKAVYVPSTDSGLETLKAYSVTGVLSWREVATSFWFDSVSNTLLPADCYKPRNIRRIGATYSYAPVVVLTPVGSDVTLRMAVDTGAMTPVGLFPSGADKLRRHGLLTPTGRRHAAWAGAEIMIDEAELKTRLALRDGPALAHAPALVFPTVPPGNATDAFDGVVNLSVLPARYMRLLPEESAIELAD